MRRKGKKTKKAYITRPPPEGHFWHLGSAGGQTTNVEQDENMNIEDYTQDSSLLPPQTEPVTNKLCLRITDNDNIFYFTL